MGKGPRTPSPEIKHSAVVSRNPEPVSVPDATVGISQKREKKDSGQKSSQTAGPKEVKLSKQEKPVPQQTANESISESSDSDSSSSSDESESEAIESVSGEERKVGSSRTQHVEREAKKKKEPVAKEPKREQREDKKPGVSRDHSQHMERSAEATKERSNDETRERNVPQEKDRHVEDRKERALDYDRREDREEKYYREHARDHRRSHDEEPERRLDSRGSKDVRDVRERDSRDHRDSRDYRDFPRVDYRDPRERERFREFDERYVTTNCFQTHIFKTAALERSWLSNHHWRSKLCKFLNINTIDLCITASQGKTSDLIVVMILNKNHPHMGEYC